MGCGAIVPYTRDTASHVDMLRELDPKRAIAAEDAILNDLGAMLMPPLGGVESPLDDKKSGWSCEVAAGDAAEEKDDEEAYDEEGLRDKCMASPYIFGGLITHANV